MKRRLIILGSLLILVIVSVVVYMEWTVYEIGSRVIHDYQPVINKYIEAINGKDVEWKCPEMTAEEMMSFSCLCDEKNCRISASADSRLGGQSIGPGVKAWSGTGMMESVFLHDAYSLGYVDLEDGSRRPSVMYVRRFKKDGRDVKLKLIAWPEDPELLAFVRGGCSGKSKGVVERIFDLGSRRVRLGRHSKSPQ